MIHREVARSLLLVVIFGVLAWVGAMACGMTMMTDSGTRGPSMLSAASPIVAIIASIVTAGIAIVGGIVMTKAQNFAVGMFAMGGAFFGFVWRLDAMSAFAFADRSPVTLIIELLILGAIAFAVMVLFERVTGGMTDVAPTDAGPPNPIVSRAALTQAAAAFVALPVGWFFARTFLPGQVIGAAIVGGLVAGLAARLLAPTVQPVLVVPAVLLSGAVGVGVGMFQLDGSTMAAAIARGELPALLGIAPMHWMVGAFLGVAMGLGWAKSFLTGEQEEQTAPRRVVRSTT